MFHNSTSSCPIPLFFKCPEESCWFSLGLEKDAPGHPVSVTQPHGVFEWALLHMCFTDGDQAFAPRSVSYFHPLSKYDLLIYSLIITPHEFLCSNLLSSNLPLSPFPTPRSLFGFPQSLYDMQNSSSKALGYTSGPEPQETQMGRYLSQH